MVIVAQVAVFAFGLTQALAAELLQGLTCIGHPSSYFLWLPLPEDVRADQIVVELVHQQISVTTAEPFAVSAHVPHAIRLALGSVSDSKKERHKDSARR